MKHFENPKELLDDLPRGVMHRNRDQHLLPSAAFMDPEEMVKSKTLAYEPSKLFLGHINGHALGIYDDRHAHLNAGSRSGKSVSHLLPDILAGGKRSFLFIDPKADVVSLVCDYLFNEGFVVRLLDPCEVGARWTERFRNSYNPMIILKDEAHLIENAGLLADGLVKPSEHGNEHWDASAQQLIEAIILHVQMFPFYEGKRNLVTVRRLLKRGVEFKEPPLQGIGGLLYEMTYNESANGLVADTAVAFSSKPQKELESIVSTADRHTKWLDYPSMQKVLVGDDFDFADLKTSTRPVAIFLSLPAGRMANCIGWLRCLLNIALNAMENTRLRPDGPLNETGTKLPVTFYLDEFHVLGRMQQILTSAAYLAGFGVKLFTVTQDLKQLSVYGEAWESLLSNAGTQIFYGVHSPFTQEYLTKRLGQTTVIVRQQNQTTHSSHMGGATGESFSAQVHPLLTGEEISRFFSRNDRHRRMLVLQAGHDPMIMSRAVYHDEESPEHKYFAGKYRRWA